MSTLITSKSIGFTLGDRWVLSDVDCQISAGQRIGVVGSNGAGKSSLINILLGIRVPDVGEVVRARDLRVGYLPQDTPKQLLSLQVREVLEHGLDMSTIAEHRLERAIYEGSVNGDAKFGELSGGQQRRVLLAKVFIAEPDLIFLDEPTNHIDLPGVLHLERQLQRFRGAMVLISHDRWLLKRLAKITFDISAGTLTVWQGDLDFYLRGKAEEASSQQQHKSRLRQHLKQEERWLLRGVSARRKRNQGRLTRLHDLRDQYSGFCTRQGKLSLPKGWAGKSGMKVMEVRDLSVGFDDNLLFENFNTVVCRGDKIGMIGPNGTGKTSLLRCLLHELSPTSGSVEHGTQLSVGYFDQTRAQLDYSVSVQDNVAGGSEILTLGERSMHVITYLEEFMFSPAQARGGIEGLSGGERNRLLLAKLFAKPLNCLVLDEPTNDLDIETLELLEAYLVDFPGTVFIISHDQVFLDNLLTRAWVLPGDGSLFECAGRKEAWLPYVQEDHGKKTAIKNTLRDKSASRSKKRKLSYKERLRLTKLPEEIMHFEQESEQLLQQLSAPQQHGIDSAAIAELSKQLHEMQIKITAAYVEWENLDSLAKELGEDI